MRLLRRRRPRGEGHLGTGVWRRAHDRFQRAVDRYHQVIEPVPDGPLRDSLEVVGADLADLLDVARELCLQAQSDAPSSGLDVPAGPDGGAPDLHRRVSRAANLAAQAAEAAAMARVAQRTGDDEAGALRLEGARRAVRDARALLTGGRRGA